MGAQPYKRRERNASDKQVEKGRGKRQRGGYSNTNLAAHSTAHVRIVYGRSGTLLNKKKINKINKLYIRALPSQGRGRGFKSLLLHHFERIQVWSWFKSSKPLYVAVKDKTFTAAFVSPSLSKATACN